MRVGKKENHERRPQEQNSNDFGKAFDSRCYSSPAVFCWNGTNFRFYFTTALITVIRCRQNELLGASPEAVVAGAPRRILGADWLPQMR
jgi:hypothetical protein